MFGNASQILINLMINLKFLVLCKVTAKQSIGGKIAKGMSVQVVEKITNSPQIKTIMETFKTQLGIEIKGVSVSTSYFTIEKLK